MLQLTDSHTHILAKGLGEEQEFGGVTDVALGDHILQEYLVVEVELEVHLLEYGCELLLETDNKPTECLL